MNVPTFLGIAASATLCLGAYILLRRGSLFIALCEWISAVIFLGIGTFYLFVEGMAWTILVLIVIVAACEVALLIHGVVAWFGSRDLTSNGRHLESGTK